MHNCYKIHSEEQYTTKKPGDIMQALSSEKMCYVHLYLFAPHTLQKKPDEEHQKEHKEIKRCSARSIM
jgi:hypothetical protein